MEILQAFLFVVQSIKHAVFLSHVIHSRYIRDFQMLQVVTHLPGPLVKLILWMLSCLPFPGLSSCFDLIPEERKVNLHFSLESTVT